MQKLKTTAISIIMLVIAFTASQVISQDTTSSGVSQESTSQDVTPEPASQDVSPEPAATDVSQESTSQDVSQESASQNSTAEVEPQSSAREKVKISGSITDAGTSEPLAGVNVLAKGTTDQTLSDGSGKFSLETSGSDVTLVFSRQGFTSREINAAGKTTINVAMASDALSLGNDVVVGYGTQKKSDLTGAVTSVRADDVMKVVSANVVSSLQGAAAGVYVTQSSGRPGGAGLDIQIRGAKSLTASNKPLYVIDGLPLSPGAEDVMSEINPSDIEAIDILKDAASCAIYGARGANGVVIITTKSGTTDKIGRDGKKKNVKITYDFYTGVTEIVQKLELFSGPEWLAMKKEARRADGLDTSLTALLDPIQLDVYNKGEWVDWQDELFKQGSQTSHNVSLSGSNEKVQALLSLGRYDEDGIFERSKFSRNSGRLNLNYTPVPKFKLNANVAVSSVEANVAGGDSTIKNSGQATAAGLSVLQTPAGKLYDSTGKILQLYTNTEKSYGNPLYLIQQSSDDNFRNRVILSSSGSYEFLPGLTYKLSGGLEFQSFKYGRYQTRFYNDQAGGGNNWATLGLGQNVNYNIDNMLSYAKEFNDANNLDMTLLYGIQSNKLDTLAASSKNLPTDLLGYNIVNQGTETQPTKRTSDEWKLESYMGRARYTLLSRYLLTLSARIDGSSKFGKNNKYGFFPSAAVAWKVEQEPFMVNATAFDQLKLRVSYGSIGNQDIPAFRALPQAEITRYSYGGTVVAGSNIGRFGNPNLKWETTQQFNVGLDYSVFNSVLEGSVEFYSSHTKDLLLAKAISSANGDTAMYDNIGKTKTKGFETNLIARIFKNQKPRGFHWNISGNIAAERTEIVATALVDANGNPVDDKANKWFIGQPIKSNYDYVFDGIVQDSGTWALNPKAKAGDIMVKDLNGDGKIDGNDRKVLGSEQPDYYGGITNTFQIMGFELSTFFVARQGVQRLNDELNRGLTGRFNSMKVDYWTPENHSNTFMRPRSTGEFPQYLSSMLYEDASYVALKNVTLSYSLSESIVSKLKVIGSLKVYLQGSNLKYWTKYKSYNPESGFLSYPMTKTYGFGLNAAF